MNDKLEHLRELNEIHARINSARVTVVFNGGCWKGTNGEMTMNGAGVWLNGPVNAVFYPWHQVLQIIREGIK